MDFFSQTYVALRGPTGAPQTPTDTVTRLADRLAPTTLPADRRAAVLALKGLARAHRALVGAHALPGLLDIVQRDAPVDPEIGRAALETVHALCDPAPTLPAAADERELGLRHTDAVVQGSETVHALVGLLADADFYVRYAACALLACLLQNRARAVQAHFLTAAGGPAGVVGLLEESREILAREALSMLAALIRKNGEIQKVLAFDGVFEKLFGIVTREGGLEGGMYVEEALKCVDTLLRFNTSNQSYFMETPLPALLCSLLYFNPGIQPHEGAPQEFALQFWNGQKAGCAALVLETIGILLGAKGPALQEGYAYTRLLIEMAFASNAPTKLKIQCLRILPANAAPMLPEMYLTPYMPVPETNGEEWDRLEAATALDALIELIMHGEYNGQDAALRAKEGMDLRAAAVGVFENFLRDDHVKEAVVAGMVPPENAGPTARSPVTPLLFALIVPPRSPPDRTAITSFQFAAIVFAHLVRHAPPCKALARAIVPPALTPLPPNPSSTDAFFVPADGGAPPPVEEAPPVTVAGDEDEDEAQSLLQLLAEHLSLAFLARGREGVSDPDAREWDRLIVAHLALLAQWLWEDPKAVRAFLEAGGMGVLVEQLNQPSEVDVVIPGLCAFLLGICYEFNREPGEITRESTYPLLSRLGPSTLAARLTRLKEDDRLKIVSPDVWVLPAPTPAALNPAYAPEYENEAEVWFDWAFVDFWKSVNLTIQRGIVADPGAAPSSSAQSGEESVLVASLRDVIAKQAAEIEALARRLQDAASAQKQEQGVSAAVVRCVRVPVLTVRPLPPSKDELATLAAVRSELAAAHDDLSASRTELAAARKEGESARAALAAAQAQVEAEKKEAEAERAKRTEVEKEQEDLLVLLDELSGKRKRDKTRMREGGMDVSEDEDEDEDEDEEEEDEDGEDE